MDPKLVEVLREAGPNDELELMLRLSRGPLPPGMPVVTRFGDIVTTRLRAAEVQRVYDHPTVQSMKAPRPVMFDRRGEQQRTEVRLPLTPQPTDRRRPERLRQTGSGVVVGIIDYGCDITHPDLRHADGSTRLKALWDQRGRGTSPDPWGYGTVHDSRSIDAALSRRNPFAELQYRIGHRPGVPSHGTHVASIAVGNGRGGGPLGIAPEAQLVFVHLANNRGRDLETLGDSLRMLEAVDFIFDQAGDQPCVINVSIGSHGGPKDGSNLLERGFEAAVFERAGRAICQSAGNYRRAGCHATHDFSSANDSWKLHWEVPIGDATGNEMEIWYPGLDTVTFSITSPDGATTVVAGPGEIQDIVVGGNLVGRVYHRRRDPNNGDHHINVFLRPAAASGSWSIEVLPVATVDGRCHAWIERDNRRHQSTFRRGESTTRGTIGTIASSRGPLVVGSYNPHVAGRPPASTSSMGPTRDGRSKPDVIAPGAQSLAANSHWRSSGKRLVRTSGTSMAAPVVTGTVACMLEAAPGLSMNDIRRIITQHAQRSAEDPLRIGRGRLRIARSVHAARTMRTRSTPRSQRDEGSVRPISDSTLGDGPEGITITPIPARGLAAWQQLINFTPAAAAIATLRTHSSRASLHQITDGHGPVNLDFYAVSITRLPTGFTAERLLEHVRLNFNSMIDTRNTRFGAVNAGADRLWRSGSPVGAPVHLDFFQTVAGRQVNVDDGTVVCAHAGPRHWVFSTVWTPWDGSHPVSGNRMWGIVPDRGRHVIFTMAADRLTTRADYIAEWSTGVAFRSADALWRSMQAGIARFVRSRGGAAGVVTPMSHRFDWAAVSARYGGRPTHTVIPRLP